MRVNENNGTSGSNTNTILSETLLRVSHRPNLLEYKWPQMGHIIEVLLIQLNNSYITFFYKTISSISESHQWKLIWQSFCTPWDTVEESWDPLLESQLEISHCKQQQKWLHYCVLGKHGCRYNYRIWTCVHQLKVIHS